VSLKELWGMMTEEDKQILSLKGEQSNDLWTYIKEWEVWLRRRYVEVAGYKLPELPMRPRPPSILYRQACVKKCRDEGIKYQKNEFTKWDDLDDERAVKFEILHED